METKSMIETDYQIGIQWSYSIQRTGDSRVHPLVRPSICPRSQGNIINKFIFMGTKQILNSRTPVRDLSHLPVPARRKDKKKQPHADRKSIRDVNVLLK